ncbi:hypothetical protein Y032_0152g2891 [Ancylostoma ceylanicum]|uniref:Uncharacterized protein n=1 Tax=Ancylostoma ceylanicum TaxID=53326 RepID=A0A016SZU6_9BILA|nr:hypothetical protein Y032_0152g2891 [Ancylostoma ceylanicum]
MENGSMLLDQATASGPTDAPVLGTMGTGVKWTTGRKDNTLRRAKGKPGITSKRELRIAAWNVRTGHQVGQKEITARKLTKCKISIASLSELRMIQRVQRRSKFLIVIEQ